MRGHIRQRGKSWQVCVFAGYGPDGRQRYVYRSAPTKRAAEAVLAQLLVEVGAGFHTGVDPTFGELAEQWFELAAPDLSPRTVSVYRWILDRHVLPHLGKVRLSRLRAADLDRLYASLRTSGGDAGKPLTAKTVRHIHGVCHRALAQAVKWGWLTANPASNATPPRLPRKAITATDTDAVIAIIDAAEERDPDLGAFLRLAAATGARRGELCALRWRDLDLNEGTLSISRAIVHGPDGVAEKGSTKTGRARRMALDRETVAVMRRHRDRCTDRAAACRCQLRDAGFVFSYEPDGSAPWRPDGVTHRFVKLRDRIGFHDVRLHDFRHHLATHLLVAGVPVRTVSERLGHANANVTLGVYAHFVPASDREAADLTGTLLGTVPDGEDGG